MKIKDYEERLILPHLIKEYEEYIAIEDKEKKIDRVNELVEEYKNKGVVENKTLLVEIFRPFLITQCNKYVKIYQGIHKLEYAIHEAMVIFGELLDEYTIGGVAYFNVFITRKLPFRLRYFFIKEIKYRGKNLSSSDEVMQSSCIEPSIDPIEDMMENLEESENMKMIISLIQSDLLNDRERDMLLKSILQGMSHEKIAESYGVSRSRVSKLIGSSLEKIRKEIMDYKNFMEGEKIEIKPRLKSDRVNDRVGAKKQMAIEIIKKNPDITGMRLAKLMEVNEGTANKYRKIALEELGLQRKSEKLAEAREKAKNMLRQNPDMLTSEIAKITGLSKATIVKYKKGLELA